MRSGSGTEEARMITEKTGGSVRDLGAPCLPS